MAGGDMDDRRGSTRTSVRHRGEHRFSLARIGPGLLAVELVLVLLAGLALVIHETNRKDKSPQDKPVAGAQLPALVDPDEPDEATGTATPSPTDVVPQSPTITGPSSSGGSATTRTTAPLVPIGTTPTTAGRPATTAPARTTPATGGARPTTRTSSGGSGGSGGTVTRPPTTRRTTAAPPPRTTKRPTVPTALPDAGIAASLVSHLNGRRQGERCGALRLDSRLSRAAQGQASDMVARHFFGHTNPDGLGPADRAAQQGFSGRVGETIAVGYENSARAVDGWWDSSEQHATLTNCSYTLVGVGYDPGRALSNYGAGAWVLLLG